MRAGLVRRLLSAAGWAAGSFLLVCSASFGLLRLLPGDPARIILGPLASQTAVESFRAAEHMDAAWWVQYGLMLRRLANGDLGTSFVQRRPVLEILLEHAPTTLALVGISVAWMLLLGIGVPLVLHALELRTGRRVFLASMTAVGASPPFATAVLLAAVFSGLLGWMAAVFDPGATVSWVLPSVALAAYPAALIALICDQALERATRSPWAIAARSHGDTHASIVVRGALPNVWRSAVGAMANGVASFLTGTLGVEVVFSMRGLGGITYQAIRSNDLPLMTGAVSFYGAAMILMTTSLRIAVDDGRGRD
jgi:ABC-type dipeptide/oligopeptide/nickel transport system permease component